MTAGLLAPKQELRLAYTTGTLWERVAECAPVHVTLSPEQQVIYDSLGKKMLRSRVGTD